MPTETATRYTAITENDKYPDPTSSNSVWYWTRTHGYCAACANYGYDHGRPDYLPNYSGDVIPVDYCCNCNVDNPNA